MTKAALLLESPTNRKEKILSSALRLHQKGFSAKERFAVLSRFYEEKEVFFTENILAESEKAIERYFDPSGMITFIRDLKKSGRDDAQRMAEEELQKVRKTTRK